MQSILQNLMARHDWGLTALAVILCLGGVSISRAMFSRAHHAHTHGYIQTRRNFVVAAAVTSGLTIWSVHFLSMQAYDIGIPVSYDLRIVLLAFAAGMAGMFLRVRIALISNSLAMRLSGALILVAGAAITHLLGMAAMRAPGHFEWSVGPILLALAVSLAFAVLAVMIKGFSGTRRILVASSLSTLSITSLYLISMNGLRFVPDAAVIASPSALASDVLLGWVGGAEILLLAVAGLAVGLAWWSRASMLGQLREAIDAMPDGMGFYDADDRLVVWNARYAEVNPEAASSLATGLSFREILEIGLKEGLYAEAKGREDDWIAERMAIRQGLSGTMEQHIAGDRWLRVQDRRTAAGGIVTVCSDITDLKRDAQALAEARDAAEAANRAKSEFLANMSHEIRTPLNGVIGLAQALDRTDLAPDQREILDLIQSSGRTLQSLLSDILDLARVESGRLALSSEPFDLSRTIQDAARLYTEPATGKGLQFFVDIAPDCDIWVEGDSVRLKQVLTNLVSNAVKFTAQGFVGLTVTRGLKADGAPVLRFTVDDTGVGFDATAKARLFNRFEQADGTITRRFGGSGLGLSICRQLAAMMDGDLDCESEPGGGSSFILTLPLKQVAAPDATAPALVAVGQQHDAPLVRVLVADDHPTNRKVVELILGQVPVELTMVENGARAVEAWRDGVFDVILMDMQMPVMDGLTATREIRLHEAAMGSARTPIVMLTANALPDHVAASHAAGADRHLAKPFNAAELIAMIGELAENRAALAA